ncbi:MAG: EamA family transporter [Acidobacteriota bacterium]
MLKITKKSWIFYAFATFFLFGITNFALGYIGEITGKNINSSVSSIIVLWIGMGTLGIMAPPFLKKIKSSIKKNHHCNFSIFGIISGLTLALGMLTLKIGFVADPFSKGPIVSIVSANAMLVAILAWIILREKLNRFQLWGMTIIITGITLIASGGNSIASFRGILFGIATMFLFGATNFLLKYSGEKGADSINMSVVLWRSAGTFGLLTLALSLLTGRGLSGLDNSTAILISFFAGFALGLGMLTLKLAMTKGPAGPAIALAGSNALMVTILDLAAFGYIPSVLKIIGMITAILGIIIIATAKPSKVSVVPK